MNDTAKTYFYKRMIEYGQEQNNEEESITKQLKVKL